MIARRHRQNMSDYKRQDLERWRKIGGNDGEVDATALEHPDQFKRAALNHPHFHTGAPLPPAP